ncbi:MAG: DUF1285 domain-containing protein [Bosea sp. (in: a-proteobacteria)]
MGVNGENKAENASPAPMQRLIAALGANPATLPPIERWNPPWCGEIDMAIHADGRWFYMGTPITRMPLVKLFASVMKLEDGRHVLVTPVEKVGIQVSDAPFLAVEMAIQGDGAARQITFRTNVDDVVTVNAAHPLRFELAPDGGLKPYVHVRRDLWARLTRALTYDLIALGEVHEVDGRQMFGVRAGGQFHAAQAADEIGEIT